MRKKTKSLINYSFIIVIFIMCCCLVMGVWLFATTPKQSTPFSTSLNYSITSKYSIELGYDKNQDGRITNDEYNLIFNNYPLTTNEDGLDYLPDVELPDGVLFEGNNYISFYNSSVKVGDIVNLRFSNYNSNADYLDTDGSQLFSYGPALKVVAKCGGGEHLNAFECSSFNNRNK